MFRHRLFRWSSLDSYLTLGAVLHLGLLLFGAIYFDRLPLWALVGLFLFTAVCYCWNMNSISHNFIHNPFFTSTPLNRGFAILESITTGVPHSIVFVEHMTHHWGNNDTKGPDGTTKDWISSYRFSRDDQPEPFWRYCLLMHFRFSLTEAFRMVRREGPSHVVQLGVECVSQAVFIVCLVLIDWEYVVVFYLPCYYAGWMLAYAENYFLHYGAQPGNRYANSVSSYNGFYNWVFFNNGFHQEHHSRPKAHWSRMMAVREEIGEQMAANGTKVIRGPHATIFIEEWLNQRDGSRRDLLQQCPLELQRDLRVFPDTPVSGLHYNEAPANEVRLHEEARRV